MTYASAKYEAATFNGLEDAIIRKTVSTIWDQGHTRCCPVLSTSCDLSMDMQSVKLLRPIVWEEVHLQENSLFDLRP